MKNPPKSQVVSSSGHDTKKMIKNGKLNLIVPSSSILFVQAEHVYIRLYFRSRQSMLYRGSLNMAWEELHDKNFLRIHRSYLVNLAHVTYFTTTYVMINDEKITIGRSYRDATVVALRQWNGG